MEYKLKPVDTIPPIHRTGGPRKKKYKEAIEAAIEHGTVALEFEDAKTAHSRASTVRLAASEFEEFVAVTVRGNELYITTDEEQAKALPRRGGGKPAVKKASKKAAKKAVKKKAGKKKRPPKSEEPDEETLDITDVE